MDERERHFIGGLLDGEDAPVDARPAPLGGPAPHFWPEPPPPYTPRPPTWAEMRQPGPVFQQPGYPGGDFTQYATFEAGGIGRGAKPGLMTRQQLYHHLPAAQPTPLMQMSGSSGIRPQQRTHSYSFAPMPTEAESPRAAYEAAFTQRGPMVSQSNSSAASEPSAMDVLAMLNVGQEIAAKVMESAAAAAVGPSASPPALPKAGKSYREAVVASSSTPPASTRPPRSATESESQSASRKPSEGADDVFMDGGNSTPGEDSPRHPGGIDSVFVDGKLGDLALTAEEMAFLAKGTSFEDNVSRRNATTSTRSTAEFQKITGRKVLAKGGNSPPGPVREAKLNNEERERAQRQPPLNFAINNDLTAPDDDEEDEDDRAAPAARGDKSGLRKTSVAAKRRRDDSDRRAKRRRKPATTALWAALSLVTLTAFGYVHAGLRWLWELVSDIGLQLWDILAHLGGRAWAGLSGLVCWAYWRTGERLRGLGRAWRERDWAGILPAWLAPRQAPPDHHWGLEESIQLPATGEEAMRRLLSCRGQDAYSILGLRADCPDEEVRRHYKRQAVLVHPDKNTAYGAEEAFKILAHAFELIETPEQRRKYDVENIHRTKAMQELDELVEQLKAKMEEALSSMQCDCGSKHKRFATKRAVPEARYCRRCKEHHHARENDIWAESHWFGFLWYYYACMDGVVYDITEWAGCPRNLLKHMKPNSHLVQYRLITGKNAGGGEGGGGGGGGPPLPNEAEMEALLSRFLEERGGPAGGPGGLAAGFGAAPGGVSSSASYRPPTYPPGDTGRPRKAGRRRKK